MFVVVVVKTSYDKETKKEENNRRQNERSPSRDKKAMTADFAPDQKLLWNFFAKCHFTKKMFDIIVSFVVFKTDNGLIDVTESQNCLLLPAPHNALHDQHQTL